MEELPPVDPGPTAAATRLRQRLHPTGALLPMMLEGRSLRQDLEILLAEHQAMHDWIAARGGLPAGEQEGQG